MTDRATGTMITSCPPNAFAPTPVPLTDLPSRAVPPAVIRHDHATGTALAVDSDHAEAI
ncbi:hypothetical protein [Planomonospora sphaerica]|uniref:hypothetical protein n=1 Tax=Planomonospora sphaerica TaxID=161355 RepID=UPI0012F7FD24|nr:hypothetical protein [Planomonospora sphaerica]